MGPSLRPQKSRPMLYKRRKYAPRAVAFFGNRPEIGHAAGVSKASGCTAVHHTKQSFKDT